MKKILSLLLVLSLTLVLGACKKDKDDDTKNTNQEAVQTALDGLQLEGIDAVIQAFTLPATGGDAVTFTWKTSDVNVLSIDTSSTPYKANITRPAGGEDDATVTLTVTANKGTVTKDKTFTVTVKALPLGAQAMLDEAETALTIVALPDFTKVVKNVFTLGTVSNIHSTVSISWSVADKADLTEPGEDATEEEKAFYNNYNADALTIGAKEQDVHAVTVSRSDVDQTVRLVATLTIDDNGTPLTVKKEFDLNIVKLADTPEGKVAEAHEELNVFRLDFVMYDFDLPTVGKYDTTITWESNNESIISVSNGKATVTRPAATTGVTLTATITFENASEEKTFDAIVINKDYTYTWRSTSTQESTINPHATDAAVASTMYGWITRGLYEGNYDWAASGVAYGDFSDAAALKFDYLPDMAAALPEKVDEDGKVWNIQLKEDLVWQDGTVITAEDFVYAWKMLLDPKLTNVRANTLYESLPILNAEAYYKQGTEGFEDAVDFATVGIKAPDTYTIQITLSEALTNWDVRSPLASGITGPVYKELYEDNMNDTKTATSYGTSMDKIMSYGPFKLKAWEVDKVVLFEKNYETPIHTKYRFDEIRYDTISAQSAIIAEFNNGTIDVAGVDGTYYPDFVKHPNLKISPDTATFRYPINAGERTDGKTNPLMKYKEFRLALYYAVDRGEYASSVNAPGIPQQGLLSPEYVVHPDYTESYRASEQGKSVFDGLSPETYGYNPEKAKELFEEAYAKAVAAGELQEGQKAWVELVMYDTERNRKNNEWLGNKITESFGADVGGENEGLFEFKITPLGLDALYAAQDLANFDITYGGWSNVKFWPISLIGQVFNSDNVYMGEKGFNTADLQITVDIPNAYAAGIVDSVTQTRSFVEWFEAAEPGGDLYDTYDGMFEDYSNVLAGMERALIDEVIAIPVSTRVTAAVYTDRVIFENPVYHSWMGWGGMEYMYMSKSDQEINFK